MKVFDEVLEQVNPLLDFNFIHFNEILQNKANNNHFNCFLSDHKL